MDSVQEADPTTEEHVLPPIDTATSIILEHAYSEDQEKRTLKNEPVISESPSSSNEEVNEENVENPSNPIEVEPQPEVKPIVKPIEVKVEQIPEKVKSRELKSLLDAVKESNLDTNIVHKRRSIEPHSHSSHGQESGGKQRAMRSQNPEFVARHKKFLHKVNKFELNSDGVVQDSDVQNVRSDKDTSLPKTPKRKKENFDDDAVGGTSVDDGKKRKSLKVDTLNINMKKDKDSFCWRCHRDGILVQCETCPRGYHPRCLKSPVYNPDRWPCPECLAILQAESTKTRSPAMRDMSLEHLCELLKYAAKRMINCPGSEPFIHPVDIKTFPDYQNYVVQPMDLTTLQSNIRNNVYGSTVAFMADAKWILHNSIIFNSCMNQSKLTSAAKSIIKICKQEMSEIETCSECYQNANTKKNSWFVEVCSKPHILLWAKLKGFPYWPAKAMTTNAAGLVDVRFFGAHDRAWIPVKECFLYSKKDPNTTNKSKRNNIAECIKEVDVHVVKLKEKFGEFYHAPYRTPYDPATELEQLSFMLPKFVPCSKVLSSFTSLKKPKSENVEEEMKVQIKRSKSPERRTPAKRSKSRSRSRASSFTESHCGDKSRASSEVRSDFGDDAETLTSSSKTSLLSDEKLDKLDLKFSTRDFDKFMEGYGTEDDDSILLDNETRKKIIHYDSESDEESLSKSHSQEDILGDIKNGNIEHYDDNDDKTENMSESSILNRGKVRTRGGYHNVTGKLKVLSSRKRSLTNSPTLMESPAKLSRRNSDMSTKSDSSRISGISDKINRVEEFSDMLEVSLGNSSKDGATISSSESSPQEKKLRPEFVSNFNKADLGKLKPVIQVNTGDLYTKNKEFRISPQSKTSIAERLMKKITESELTSEVQKIESVKKQILDSLESSTSSERKDNLQNNADVSSSDNSDVKITKPEKTSNENKDTISKEKLKNNEKESVSSEAECSDKNQSVSSSTETTNSEPKASGITKDVTKNASKENKKNEEEKIKPSNKSLETKDNKESSSVKEVNDKTILGKVKEKETSSEKQSKDKELATEKQMIEKESVIKKHMTEKEPTTGSHTKEKESSTNKQVKEKESAAEKQMKQNVSPSEKQMKEKVPTSEKQVKEKVPNSEKQVKEKVNSEKQVKEKINSEKQVKEKEFTQKQVREKGSPTDKQVKVKEKESPTDKQVKVKEKESPTDKQVKVKEKESPTDKQVKVKESTTVKQVKEKETSTEKQVKESSITKPEKRKEKEVIKENSVKEKEVFKSITESKPSTSTSTEKVKRLDDSPEYHDIDEDSEESGSSNGEVDDSEEDEPLSTVNKIKKTQVKLVNVSDIISGKVSNSSTEKYQPEPSTSGLTTTSKPKPVESTNIVTESIEIKSEPRSEDEEDMQIDFNKDPEKRRYDVTLTVVDKQKKAKIEENIEPGKPGFKITDNMSRIIDNVATNFSKDFEKIRSPVANRKEITLKPISKLIMSPKQKARKSFPNSPHKMQVPLVPIKKVPEKKDNQQKLTQNVSLKVVPTLQNISSQISSPTITTSTTTTVSSASTSTSKENVMYISPQSQSSPVVSSMALLPPNQPMTLTQSVGNPILAMVHPGMLIPQNSMSTSSPVSTSSSQCAIVTANLDTCTSTTSLFPQPQASEQIAHPIISDCSLPDSISRAVGDLLCKAPPKLKPRPPGPLSDYYDEGSPSSSGPTTNLINSISHRLTDYFRGLLKETLHDLSSIGDPESKIRALELELETLKHKHAEEMLELRKNISSILKDVQKSIVEEKAKIVDDTRASCEAERLRCVEEAKSKQWCAFCLKEAQFYCCWNTSYCDYPCQQKHWATHMKTCSQTSVRNVPPVVVTTAVTTTVNSTIKPKQTYSNSNQKTVLKSTRMIVKQASKQGVPMYVPVQRPLPGNQQTITLVESTPGNFEILGNHGPISLGGKLVPTTTIKVKPGNLITVSSSSSSSTSTTGSGAQKTIILSQKSQHIANKSTSENKT